ncbi:SUMF1/EgtB/PvdO family nonheme iron enzyme, partial [Janibacter hoylei]|uniref:SUMF1/EgtB/PvdO family nonheme iron enzyme n=1 Tax=Janibacter hoylei TaxID=364298 RepID=UPI0024904DA8
KPLQAQRGQTQFLGDLWEWTSSAYLPYRGFKVREDAVGEYNGKFMCNQKVLRGGSFATPADHIRISYRNFVYPPPAWHCPG